MSRGGGGGRDSLALRLLRSLLVGAKGRGGYRNGGGALLKQKGVGKKYIPRTGNQKKFVHFDLELLRNLREFEGSALWFFSLGLCGLLWCLICSWAAHPFLSSLPLLPLSPGSEE